jgi:hypothetical protein
VPAWHLRRRSAVCACQYDLRDVTWAVVRVTAVLASVREVAIRVCSVFRSVRAVLMTVCSVRCWICAVL